MKDEIGIISGMLKSSLSSSEFRGSFEIDSLVSDAHSGNWQAELSGEHRRIRITCDRGQVFLSVSYESSGNGWMDLMHLIAMLRPDKNARIWEYPKPKGPSDRDDVIEQITPLWNLLEGSIDLIDKYVEKLGVDAALSNYQIFAEGRVQSRLREQSDMEP